MRHEFRKQKLPILLALLLLWVTVCPVFGAYNSDYNEVTHAVSTTEISTLPCHQNQVAKTPASQSCQEHNLQFYAILPDFLNTFQSTSGKLAFLFIIALLAMAPINRPFKPPKFLRIL